MSLLSHGDGEHAGIGELGEGSHGIELGQHGLLPTRLRTGFHPVRSTERPNGEREVEEGGEGVAESAAAGLVNSRG